MAWTSLGVQISLRLRSLSLPGVGNTQFLKMRLILSNIQRPTPVSAYKPKPFTIARRGLKEGLFEEACFHSDLMKVVIN